MESKLPPNITDGHSVHNIKSDGLESLKDNLEKCLEIMPTDKFALIIIQHKIADMINCKCKKWQYGKFPQIKCHFQVESKQRKSKLKLLDFSTTFQ